MKHIKEMWKWIPEYRGLYKISNHGGVLSFHRSKSGKRMRTNQYINGHPYIMLTKDKSRKIYLLRRLVAEAFVPNPDNLKYVHSKDGDVRNVRCDNLEYVGSYDHMIRMVKSAGKNIPLVMCVETGHVYRGYSDAAHSIGVSPGVVRYSVIHGTKTRHGETFALYNDEMR